MKTKHAFYVASATLATTLFITADSPVQASVLQAETGYTFLPEQSTIESIDFSKLGATRTIFFSQPIDPTTIQDNIKLFNVETGKEIPIEAKLHPTNNKAIVYEAKHKNNTQYRLLISNKIKSYGQLSIPLQKAIQFNYTSVNVDEQNDELASAKLVPTNTHGLAKLAIFEEVEGTVYYDTYIKHRQTPLQVGDQLTNSEKKWHENTQLPLYLDVSYILYVVDENNIITKKFEAKPYHIKPFTMSISNNKLRLQMHMESSNKSASQLFDGFYISDGQNGEFFLENELKQHKVQYDENQLPYVEIPIPSHLNVTQDHLYYYIEYVGGNSVRQVAQTTIPFSGENESIYTKAVYDFAHAIDDQQTHSYLYSLLQKTNYDIAEQVVNGVTYEGAVSRISSLPSMQAVYIQAFKEKQYPTITHIQERVNGINETYKEKIQLYTQTKKEIEKLYKSDMHLYTYGERIREDVTMKDIEAIERQLYFSTILPAEDKNALHELLQQVINELNYEVFVDTSSHSYTEPLKQLLNDNWNYPSQRLRADVSKEMIDETIANVRQSVANASNSVKQNVEYYIDDIEYYYIIREAQQFFQDIYFEVNTPIHLKEDVTIEQIDAFFEANQLPQSHGYAWTVKNLHENIKVSYYVKPALQYISLGYNDYSMPLTNVFTEDMTIQKLQQAETTIKNLQLNNHELENKINDALSKFYSLYFASIANPLYNTNLKTNMIEYGAPFKEDVTTQQIDAVLHKLNETNLVEAQRWKKVIEYSTSLKHIWSLYHPNILNDSSIRKFKSGVDSATITNALNTIDPTLLEQDPTTIQSITQNVLHDFLNEKLSILYLSENFKYSSYYPSLIEENMKNVLTRAEQEALVKELLEMPHVQASDDTIIKNIVKVLQAFVEGDVRTLQEATTHQADIESVPSYHIIAPFLENTLYGPTIVEGTPIEILLQFKKDLQQTEINNLDEKELLIATIDDAITREQQLHFVSVGLQ